MLVVFHLDDGVWDPLLGHLVSDDAFDPPVDLRERAEGLKPRGESGQTPFYPPTWAGGPTCSMYTSSDSLLFSHSMGSSLA